MAAGMVKLVLTRKSIDGRPTVSAKLIGPGSSPSLLLLAGSARARNPACKAGLRMAMSLLPTLFTIPALHRVGKRSDTVGEFVPR